MNKQVFSPAWELVKQDSKKLIKGLIISVVGAVAAYLGQVSGLIDYNAYGQSGPFIALAVGVLCSNIANTLNKWISSTTYIK
jgi:hypothetical protein